MSEVVIIGAGLTGLSTAYFLEQNGYFDYTIVEKNDRAGGLLRSEFERGFTFDYTGHFLHCNNQTFYEFLRDVFGMQHLDLIERSSGIYSNGIITDYPFQMNLYGLPLDVAVECIEKFVTRPKKIGYPRSFHDWVLKHFGAGFGKHFFFSYNQKLLAYDVNKVYPSWTGNFVPSTNLRAIIQGTIAKNQRKNIGYNSSFYYPQQGGIESVIKQLLQKITHSINTNRSASRIDPVQKRVFFSDGTSEHYNILVSTMPLNNLLTILQPTSARNFESASKKLLCNAVINVNLGFSTALENSYHWIYFPEKKFSWYRLGFWHAVCPQLVPPQHAAIFSEYSYIQQNQHPNFVAKKAETLTKQLLTFLKLEKSQLVAQKTLHLDNAYVIYDAWRENNIDKLLSQLQVLEIYSIGRYGEWKYSTMQDAVLDGQKTATQAIQKLTQGQHRIYPALRDINPHAGMKEKPGKQILG